MNGIDQIAEIVQRPNLGADGVLREKLDLHIVDTIGAWIAATQTAEGKALIVFRNRMRAADKTETPSLFGDIATHVALVRLSEIDDIHLKSMTTPGSVAIPAALTLAAALPEANTSDIGAAVLAGYEAMIRLGLAIKGPDALYRDIWPTYFAAGFAAAAVAARLLRLDTEQTAHALALAITTASPSVGQHHAVTTARWLSVGNAARNGLIAAFAAQAGFTADVDVLRSRLLPDIYGIEPDIAATVGDAPAFLDVSLKPWCAARQTMPATQGLREILETGIAANEIAEITAHVLPPHLKMIDHGVRPGDRASYLTSLPYQLAVAALQPDKRLGLDLKAAVSPAELQSLMARVKIIGDETLLTDYPARWPARIVVTTPSRRDERRIAHLPGDPERPLSKAAVEGKFREFVGAVSGDATISLLQSGLSVLEERVSLTSLMNELEGVGARAAPGAGQAW
jgi:2-methylcitrate dehydratase PrpD